MILRRFYAATVVVTASTLSKELRRGKRNKGIAEKPNNLHLVDQKAAENVSRWTGVNNRKACILIRKFHKFFCDTPTEEMDQRVLYLEKKNIDQKRLQRFVWLLFLPSDELEKGVQKIVDTLDLEFEEAVSLLKLSRGRYANWLETTKTLWTQDKLLHEEFTRPGSTYRHRIDYIAERMQCKPSVVTDIISVLPEINDYPFDKIKTLLTLLIDEAHLTTLEISTEPAILTHEISLIEKRIKIAQEYNVRMTNQLLTAKEEDFNFHISYTRDSVPILEAHSNLIEFLVEHLECGRSFADKLVLRAKPLRSVKHSDIKRRIQLLLSKGLTLSDIAHVGPCLVGSDSALIGLYEGLKSMNVSDEEFKLFFFTVLKTKYRFEDPISVEDSKIEVLDDDD